MQLIWYFVEEDIQPPTLTEPKRKKIEALASIF